ncbi:MAG: DUF4281 domain-containing protein [Acidobacteriaceae bacterium]|nr:DUF4281 domain-containing protein [Acidobacteriaceae bacterium]MBV9035183.1 DUF4281 domain-containing protein [Acidobacteriaceae bacterium]MBV9223681.1 DUF4281 domain-containing protein [Acidobacteriaceae bacterium]MBV9676700.1 DUF4281 domain-containing protein [Acidobacteriaceae bacterium]
MTADQIFQVCNTLALLGWLVLVLFGWKRWASSLATAVLLPLLFAVIYSALLLTHWGGSSGSFNSLAGVASLFSNPWLLLAGWVHYLAFDLFVGSWEARDALAHQIPHLAVIPCLLLTFLFGPVGLLLYLLLRFTLRRKIQM